MASALSASPGLFCKADGKPMRFRLDESIVAPMRRGLVQKIESEHGYTRAHPSEADYIIIERHAAARSPAHLRKCRAPFLMPEWVSRCIKVRRLVGEDDDYGGFRIHVEAGADDSESMLGDEDELSENGDLEDLGVKREQSRSPSIQYTGSRAAPVRPSPPLRRKGKEVDNNRSSSPVQVTAHRINVPPKSGHWTSAATSHSHVPPTNSHQRPDGIGTSYSPTMPLGANPVDFSNMFMNNQPPSFGSWPNFPAPPYMNTFSSMMAPPSATPAPPMFPVMMLPADILAHYFPRVATTNTSSTGANDGADSSRTPRTPSPSTFAPVRRRRASPEARARGERSLPSPPPTAQRVTSTSTHAERNNIDIFVSSSGRPLSFYMPSELNDRIELCRLIKNHGGVINTSMRECDYILLTPKELLSLHAVAASNHKPLLRTWWVKACIKQGRLLPLGKYELELPEKSATRVTHATRHASTGKVDPSSDEEELLIATASRSALQRRRRASFCEPGQRLVLPKPPTEVVAAPRGNLYTEEDEEYLVEFARVRLAQDPSLKMNAILTEIANTTPHHSLSSWSSHYGRKKERFDHEIRTGQTFISSAVIPSSDPEDMPGDEFEDTDDDEPVGGYDFRLPRRHHRRNDSDSGDFERAVRHVAGLPADALITSLPLWETFAKNTTRSSKAWIEYVRKRKSAILIGMERLKRGGRVSETECIAAAATAGHANRGHNTAVEALSEAPSDQEDSDEPLSLPKSKVYTEQDFQDVVKHIAESSPEELITSGALWTKFHKDHPGHTPGAWAEYVRNRRAVIVQAVDRYRRGHVSTPSSGASKPSALPISTAGRRGGLGFPFTDQDLHNVIDHIWRQGDPPAVLTTASIWTDFAVTHPSHSHKSWIEFVRRKEAYIREELEERRREADDEGWNRNGKRQMSFELSDEHPVFKRTRA